MARSSSPPLLPVVSFSGRLVLSSCPSASAHPSLCDCVAIPPAASLLPVNPSAQLSTPLRAGTGFCHLPPSMLILLRWPFLRCLSAEGTSVRVFSGLPGKQRAAASSFTDGETGAWSYPAAEEALISVSELGFGACTYILVQSPCSDRQH